MEKNIPPHAESSVPHSGMRGKLLRDIYRVWLFRKWLPAFVLEVAVLTAVIYQFAKVVFLQRVVENATNVFFTDPAGIVSFFIAAFANAPAATKLLSIVAIVLVVLLLRLLTQGILRFILVRENYFGNIGK